VLHLLTPSHAGAKPEPSLARSEDSGVTTAPGAALVMRVTGFVIICVELIRLPTRIGIRTVQRDFNRSFTINLESDQGAIKATFLPRSQDKPPREWCTKISSLSNQGSGEGILMSSDARADDCRNKGANWACVSVNQTDRRAGRLE
jgi:hypothetical protein